MEAITRKEVVDFISEFGYVLFGKYASEIGALIADKVIEEYEEAGDGNLTKAVAWTIGAEFGMFD